MEKLSSNFQKIDNEEELLKINGGHPVVVAVGFIASAGAILDYGYKFYKGAKKGWSDGVSGRRNRGY